MHLKPKHVCAAKKRTYVTVTIFKHHKPIVSGALQTHQFGRAIYTSILAHIQQQRFGPHTKERNLHKTGVTVCERWLHGLRALFCPPQRMVSPEQNKSMPSHLLSKKKLKTRDMTFGQDRQSQMLLGLAIAPSTSMEGMSEKLHLKTLLGSACASIYVLAVALLNLVKHAAQRHRVRPRNACDVPGATTRSPSSNAPNFTGVQGHNP